MIASNCQHEKKHVHGKTKTGVTRYKCALCGKTFTASTNLLDGMRIGLDRAAEIINLLCEGMSVAVSIIAVIAAIFGSIVSAGVTLKASQIRQPITLSAPPAEIRLVYPEPEPSIIEQLLQRIVR